MANSNALISAMITPAILILATGSLISSAYNRYGRLFDRMRTLAINVAEGREGFLLEPRWLGRYELRLNHVRWALVSFFGSVACFVSSSLAIAAGQEYGGPLVWFGPSLVIVGAALLLVGSGRLLAEALVGGQQVMDELLIARSIHEGKTPES